ncbi:hypothetical protein [Flavobacterium sp.]|uniref:hypothetical protein n=1 Tax=Flavobacterium sp. TaxID=239 RepID=UPI002FDE794D
MKKVMVFAFVFLLVSCQKEIDASTLPKLNGYWEIKQVTLADGETKDYKVNETVDFIEIKDKGGFRQKVMPQFDGTFKTNGIKENLKVFKVDHSLYLECQTNYGKWNEEILTLEDSVLVLKNKQGLIYSYKKFKPFSLK